MFKSVDLENKHGYTYILYLFIHRMLYRHHKLVLSIMYCGTTDKFRNTGVGITPSGVYGTTWSRQDQVSLSPSLYPSSPSLFLSYEADSNLSFVDLSPNLAYGLRKFAAGNDL